MRALLDARLNELGAHLDAQLYDEALTYLLTKAWELSGLDEDGVLRIGFRVRIGFDVDELRDGEGQDKGWFPREESAQRLGETIVAEMPGVIVEISEEPPPGAFDPELGLSFSTYSRRILAMRVVDWYRSTFGDTRYGSRKQMVSLEAIAEKHELDGDDLERFIYQEALGDPFARDALDDVLTRATLAG